MKPLPFLRLNVGDIFNDMDGTTFVKIGKCLTPNKDEPGTQHKELNCMILIPNKPKDARGQLRFKNDDIYCEVFDNKEIAELKIEHTEDTAASNE